MPSPTGSRPVLVTGASGRTGGALVRQLTAAGVPVRAGLRDPATAALPAGAEPVRVDFADHGSVRAAAAGARAAFLLWPFWGAEPVAEHGDAVAAALAATGRVVYLSSQVAAIDPDQWWGRVEAAVTATGAEWTHLRPTGFAANTLQWADQIRAGDEVRWMVGDAARSLIAEEDMAAVAARALLDDDLVGTRPVLTGPGLVTQREQVAAIGAALGRELRWTEVTEAELAGRLGPMVREMVPAWRAMAEHPEPVTGEVERILGRPATPFAAWARANAAGFR